MGQIGETIPSGILVDATPKCHTFGMGTARKSRSTRPRGRKPKGAPNVKVVWTTAGWRFQANVQVRGVRHWGQCFVELADAVAEARDMKHRGSQVTDSDCCTLREGMEAVLDACNNRNTRRYYAEHFETILDYFGEDEGLHEIVPARLEDFAEQRRREGISETRINKNLKAIGRVFRLAIKRGKYPGVNPIERIEFRTGQPTLPSWYSVDEVAELLRFFATREEPTADRMRDWCIILFCTGLRREEFAQLPSDLDSESGAGVDMDREIIIPHGKRGQRMIPITDSLRPALISLRGKDYCGFLLPAGKAKPGSKRTDADRRAALLAMSFRRWRPLLPDKLRSRFRAHTFRHSLKTALANAKCEEHFRDAWLGHSRGVRGHYEHAPLEPLQEEAHKIIDRKLGWVFDPRKRKPAKRRRR